MSNVPLVRSFLVNAVQAHHVTLATAADQIRSFGTIDEDDVRQAVAELEKLAQQNISTGIRKRRTGSPWYYGHRENGMWARYRDSLIQKQSPGLADLHDSTTNITAQLANPNKPGEVRKGLVMGNVQSGKTRNFAGVIAKAADEGYRLVIVLAGLHNNLRQQTQVRLDGDVFWRDTWHGLTNSSGDFGAPEGGEALFNNNNMFMSAVVKKNPKRLHNLVTWLRNIPIETRRAVPALIIDDEADQASPNSLEAKKRVSAINGLLQELLRELPSATYLAYTATPYANVLIDPNNSVDLFPSDFITTIPTGEGYFGAERVFGISNAVDLYGEATPGLDMVRTIPPEEAAALKPPSKTDDQDEFDPEPPTTLVDAVRWFVLATATRRARGQRGHSSMLVHSTHFALPHFRMADRLRTLTEEFLGDLENVTWKQTWEFEISRVASEASVATPTWDAVEKQVPSVLKDIEVIVDNGSSLDRLDYSGPAPRTVIAVGGGTLSRGLTLEGLCVSYFTRNSTSYDTLLQMGRWFGYRPGYEDLPRLWVTRLAVDDYRFLALVEQDLRTEIDMLAADGQTPNAVGIRIRSHPGRLEVTTKSKMVHAENVQLGLSGVTRQTFRLDGSDPAITARQTAALDELLATRDLTPIAGTSRYIARDLPAHDISRFLGEYGKDAVQAHFAVGDQLSQVQEWIVNAAAPWNVVLMGNSNVVAADGKTPLGTMSLAGRDVRMVNRAPLNQGNGTDLNFKAIMSLTDRLADIPAEAMAGQSPSTEASIRATRRDLAQGRGLVLVYPISHASVPRASNDENSDSGTRMALGIDHDLMGLGVVFPYVIDESGQHGAFISVRPRPVFDDVNDEGDAEELASMDDTEEDAHIDLATDGGAA